MKALLMLMACLVLILTNWPNSKVRKVHNIVFMLGLGTLICPMINCGIDVLCIWVMINLLKLLLEWMGLMFLN